MDYNRMKRHNIKAAEIEISLACFKVGGQFYGLDILGIREIVRPMKLRPVPKGPAFVEGLMDLRGAILPVVDLRRRFDLEPSVDQGKRRIVIAAIAGRMIGLLVDEVAEIKRFSSQDILPAPDFLTGQGVEFFLGVCRRKDDIVLILDLGRILSTNQEFNLPLLSQPLPPVPPEA